MASRNPSRDIFNLLAVVVAVVVIAALYFAKVVFVPLALATLFSFILTPLVKLLERLRLGRAASVLLVVFFTLAAVSAIGWVVGMQFVGVLNELPEYQSNIKDKLDSLHFTNNKTLTNASSTMNQISNALASHPDTPPQPLNTRRSPNNFTTPRAPLPVEVIKPASLPLESAQSVVELLLQALIVLVFTSFMLLRRENLRNRFISLVGQQRLTSMTHALDEAGDRVGRYLRAQLAVNAAYGAFIGLGLYLIGIPGGLLWGVIVGILRYLPYVGPPLGGLMPLTLSLAIFHGWKIPLITFALFVTTELLMYNVVEPLLYRAHTGISPLAILVAAIFWTVLWGPIGLVVSTPLTVCLVVMGRHLPHLGFLPILFGDEPVTTPDVIVYQRLLASDQAEAEQVLESQLEEKSLAEVYDSVLIPALNLAEQDRHREQIDEDTAKSIYRSASEIIEVLYDRSKEFESRENLHPGLATDETSPELPSFRPLKVLGIPARDQADAIAGAMLAQLLERAGHKSICLLPGTPEEILSQVRMEEPDAVFISALPPFVISHSRALYRALKQQSPSLPVVIGLWNFPGETETIARRMGVVSDPAPVTKLADAVREISHTPLAPADPRLGVAPVRL